MKQKIFNILISLAVCNLGFLLYLDYISKEEVKEPLNKVEIIEVEPTFFDKAPKEGLMEALEYYNIKHKEIVYAQAILETGHFKSNVCKKYNNLFGLYNSKLNDYYRYDNWVESVEAYYKMIQSKYDKKPPNTNYYEFLDDIGYAEDSLYTTKLKRIVKREFNK